MMKLDFTTRPIMDRIDDEVFKKYGVRYPREVYLAIMNIFIDGMFEAMRNNEDIKIPAMGSFVVNGPSYAAYLRKEELVSQGITDPEVLYDECYKVAYAEKVRISQYNERPMMHMRNKGEKFIPRVHCIRDNMEKQERHLEKNKGKYTKIVQSAKLNAISKRWKKIKKS